MRSAQSLKWALLNIAVALSIGGASFSVAAADGLPPAPTYIPGTRITPAKELPLEPTSGKNAEIDGPAAPKVPAGSPLPGDVASGPTEPSEVESSGSRRETDLNALDPYIPAPGQWALIPGSSIVPALPNDAELGAGLCEQIYCHRALSVLTAWNALGYDKTTHCLWALANGGHADYGGNETYRYCLGKPEDGWKRITEPAPLTGALIPTKAVNQTCRAPAAGPMSSHTYDGVVWIPGTAKFFWLGTVGFCHEGMGPSSAWIFDSDTMRWTALQDLGKYARFARTDIDPVSGDILAFSRDTLRAIDPKNLNVKWTTGRASDLGAGSAVVHSQRREFYLLANGAIYSAKLDVPPKEIAIRKIANFPELGGAFGMAVHSPSGDIVMWDGEHTIYVYNPARQSLNVLPPAAGPAPTHGNRGRVYSQWLYLPEKNVFLGISPSEGIWMWRPGSDLAGDPADTAAQAQPLPAPGPSEQQAATDAQEATSNSPSNAGTAAQAQPLPTSGPSEAQAGTDGQDATPGPPADTSFADLCAKPETLLCDPLDDDKITGPYIKPTTKNLTMTAAIASRYGDWRAAWHKAGREVPQLDTTMKAEGQGSLKFTIASQSDAGGASLYTVDVDPDHVATNGVGVGQTMRVRFKVRWSCDVLYVDCDPTSPTYKQVRRAYKTKSGYGGIKIFSIGEGDRGTAPADYMDSGEGIGGIVTGNFKQFGVYDSYVQVWYLSVGKTYPKINGITQFDIQPGRAKHCWTKDPATGRKLTEAWPDCHFLRADEWVTIQADLYYGGCTDNSKDPALKSRWTLWVADEGRPFDLVMDAPVNLRCGGMALPTSTFGKIWLTPYNTAKDPAEVHPVGYVWYDSLWVSKITH
jgi:hypothetical protein